MTTSFLKSEAYPKSVGHLISHYQSVLSDLRMGSPLERKVVQLTQVLYFQNLHHILPHYDQLIGLTQFFCKTALPDPDLTHYGAYQGALDALSDQDFSSVRDQKMIADFQQICDELGLDALALLAKNHPECAYSACQAKEKKLAELVDKQAPDAFRHLKSTTRCLEQLKMQIENDLRAKHARTMQPRPTRS